MSGTERIAASPWFRLSLRVAGAGFLAATAAIHLDLYLTGYRTIPTIGWMFLGQVVAGFVLAAAVLVTGSRLVAAAAAGFALATLGGYLLSVLVGLFGFTEVRTTAGIVAGVIEVAAFDALAVYAVIPAPGDTAERAGLPAWLAKLRSGQRGAATAATALATVALVLLGVTVAQASGGQVSATVGGRAILRVTHIGGAAVLTNAKGYTLYLFGLDTSTTSACSGACLAYWPPVIGTPVLPPGTPGALGTIRRTDGKIQATYNGHPLYTYIGDRTPGQANGNGITLNGGIWREIVVSG
jgi:predicted lipoprotein with Yx(FWY)xxD motif